MTLCANFRLPAPGVAAFRAYEDAVSPLLAAHGGLLRGRMRTGDGTTGIHVIWFPSPAHVATYRADARGWPVPVNSPPRARWWKC